MRNVFISYSSRDAEDARGLAADIQSLGHQVWFDQALSGGQRWWDHILEEIRKADVLIFAVSAASADSRACLSELRYAEALGKPIVPVTVEPSFAESLLPPSLSQLQRVDYTTQDKGAFAALLRAFATLPEAPPLPAELPEGPQVPASYLFDLKTAIDEPGHMEGDRQDELLRELRGRLGSGHSHADVLALTRRFRQREDLLLRIDRHLEDFEAELHSNARSSAPAQVSMASSAPRLQADQAYQVLPQYQQHRAPELDPGNRPPTGPAFDTPSIGGGAGEQPVPWFWWLVVVFFGLIGGVVAYFVHRDKSPSTAKNLLLGGIAASVAWVLISIW